MWRVKFTRAEAKTFEIIWFHFNIFTADKKENCRKEESYLPHLKHRSYENECESDKDALIEHKAWVIWRSYYYIIRLKLASWAGNISWIFYYTPSVFLLSHVKLLSCQKYFTNTWMVIAIFDEEKSRGKLPKKSLSNGVEIHTLF
jgi:hypothetical protein